MISLKDKAEALFLFLLSINRLFHSGSNSLQKSSTIIQYKFGSIETIPGLPNEGTARKILETLANDPGVLACLAKHQWNVGCLAELYPDGKVGERVSKRELDIH